MPYSVKGFFEINEDMVQILLMLEVLFTQDSKVEDLFCSAPLLYFLLKTVTEPSRISRANLESFSVLVSCSVISIKSCIK